MTDCALHCHQPIFHENVRRQMINVFFGICTVRGRQKGLQPFVKGKP
jgi:hypothetical protein